MSENITGFYLDEDQMAAPQKRCEICQNIIITTEDMILNCGHAYCRFCYNRNVSERVRCLKCEDEGVVSSRPVLIKSNSLPKEEIKVEDGVKSKPGPALKQSVSAPKEESLDLIRNNLIWEKYLNEIPCQVCVRREKKVTAYAKCTDCCRFFCESCKGIHDQVPAYEKHVVILLNDNHQGPNKLVCRLHEQKLTNVCIKCFQYLCVDCSFSEEHLKHLDSIFDLRKGTEKVKVIASDKVEDVHSLWGKLNDKLDTGNANMNRLNELVMQINETRLEIVSRIDQDAERLHKDLEHNYKQPIMQHNQNCSKLQEEAVSVMDKFKELDQRDLLDVVADCKDVVETVDYLKSVGETCLAFVKNVPALSTNDHDAELGNLSEDQSEPMEGFEQTIMEKKLQNPTLTLHMIQINGKKLCRPVQICTLDKESVLVADAALPFVSRIDTSGNLISTYHSQSPVKSTSSSEDLINAVVVAVDYLYIADNQGFTIFPRSPQKRVKYIKCGRKIVDMSEWISEKLLILEHEPGCLVLFDMKSGESEVVLNCLNKPLYLTAKHTLHGRRIVITERDQHTIKVFDENFKKLNFFGVKGKRDSQILYPYATALTSTSLLVSDGGNHRISLFTLEGIFIRHVVTERHGLKWPTSIAYQEGLLWVTECIESDRDKHTAIKCFQFEQ